MRRVLPLIVLLSSCTRETTPSHTESVYGSDDRMDIHQTTPEWRERARAVGLVVERQFLSRTPDGMALTTEPLTSSMGVCSDQTYANEPSVTAGTGFLVAPDLLVTAGHVVDGTGGCDELAIVFDFAYGSADGEIEEIRIARDENVFFCKSVIAYREEAEGADYAVVRLDRPVTGRTPLTLRTSGQVPEGTPLTIIGHPSGLPMKIAAGDSRVRKVEKEDGYFRSDLDSFAGNSGSPVFNSETGVVEGILVRGAEDYEFTGGRGCAVISRCALGECLGEDATLIGEVLPFLGDTLVQQGLAKEIVVKSPALELAIPDNDPNGVSVTLAAEAEGEIVSAQVLLDVEHPSVPELVLNVETPDGGRFRTRVSSPIASDLRSVVTVNVGPELRDGRPVAGMQARGDWRITVADSARFDSGKLLSVELKLLTKP